jgi:hypothetical protein
VIDTVRDTINFLRKATAEIREMAAGIELGVAEQLRDVADQCEAEADELSVRFGIEPIKPAAAF